MVVLLQIDVENGLPHFDTSQNKGAIKSCACIKEAPLLKYSNHFITSPFPMYIDMLFVIYHMQQNIRGGKLSQLQEKAPFTGKIMHSSCKCHHLIMHLCPTIINTGNTGRYRWELVEGIDH